MHRRQATGLRIAGGWQVGSLFQLTEGRNLQRFFANVLHVITHVHRILTALQGEGFGEDVACFIGIRQRNDDFVLAFRQHKRIFIDVIQRAGSISRVIRAITTG